MSEKPISPLRQRMLDDMNMRRFVPETQREYIRAVKKLASFLGRSPDTATAEDLRAVPAASDRDRCAAPERQHDRDGAAVLLQGDARPARDDAPSRVRLRAAQAAARALARRGAAPAGGRARVPSTRRRSASPTAPACAPWRWSR